MGCAEGKRDRQSLAATFDCPPESQSRRLFVTEATTKRRFLVDTGSDLCCYPRSWLSRRPQVAEYTLRAANGSDIKTYGLLPLCLNLGLRRDFHWNFVIADVSTAIIGSDFLAHYDLLPDCGGKRLLDKKTGMSCSAVAAAIEQVSVRLIMDNLSILAEFPDITRPPGIQREIKHRTVHHIRTTDGPPVSCRPRRLGPLKLAAAKKEFEDMVRCGTARPSTSAWSSPLHMARKRDSTWRPCGDFRALNARTIPDRYPVRHIGDFNQNISGSTVFSTIDLVKAYQQIPVAENDICKTAIITPFGLFDFPFMTFGLRNAGQTFQRFIDEVVQGLNFVYAYVDDILVFSRDAQEHTEHLRALFRRLQQYGVVINPSKCRFGLPEVTFLGYHISAAGTRPPVERITALQNFPLPKTIQGVRRFLGMVNYYRRFLPKAALLQAPLVTAVAETKGKGAQPFPWTTELEDCFTKCKQSLSNATLLAHPVGDAPLGLYTDASSTHVGSCLQQRVNNTWQPIAFFSKKLTAKQAEWPAYYRELLAVYESVQHFRHILEAQHATIYTDHKPLLYAFVQRREKLPPAQLNQLSFISQYTTDIQHISGIDNVVADTMSRVEAIALQDDYAALAQDQERDEELQALRGKTSMTLERINIPGLDISLLCDTSTGKPRPYVTPRFRRGIFERLHNLSHPGARSTARLVADRYVWPAIHKDCRAWARSCVPCQRAKVTRHVTAPLGHFPHPSARFRHVHLDIIGPLTSSNGHTYCLTAIDRYTRWPEVWPINSITAEEIAFTFVNGWISRFGVPEIVTTDQGRQFEADLFRRLMQHCGTKRIRTTSYHPCANGMVERLHRQLKAALMCHAETWSMALPLVLLGMRSALKEDLKTTSAELVYGEPLRLPGELLHRPVQDRYEDVTDFVTQLRGRINNLRPVPASRHTQSATFVFADLATCTHVFLRDDTVRRPLQTPYTGPHEVLRRRDKTLTLRINGRETEVSIDRVKPAYFESESSPSFGVPVIPIKNLPTVPPTSSSQDSAADTMTAVSPPSPSNLATSSSSSHFVSPSPVPSPSASASPTAPPKLYTTRSGRQVRFVKPFDL